LIIDIHTVNVSVMLTFIAMLIFIFG